MSSTNARCEVAFSSLRMGYDRAVVDRFVAVEDLLPELRNALTYEGHGLSNPTIKYLTPRFAELIQSLLLGEDGTAIDAFEIVSLKGHRYQMHGVYANPLTWQSGLSVLIFVDPAGKSEVNDPIRKHLVRDRAGMAWAHATMQQAGGTP